jgi:hypothetical protein
MVVQNRARHLDSTRIKRRQVSFSLSAAFGIDSAHSVRPTRGPGGRSSTIRDHLHRGDSVRPYTSVDADKFIDDFWREVEAILKKAGVE